MDEFDLVDGIPVPHTEGPLPPFPDNPPPWWVVLIIMCIYTAIVVAVSC